MKGGGETGDHAGRGRPAAGIRTWLSAVGLALARTSRPTWSIAIIAAVAAIVLAIGYARSRDSESPQSSVLAAERSPSLPASMASHTPTTAATLMATAAKVSTPAPPVVATAPPAPTAAPTPQIAAAAPVDDAPGIAAPPAPPAAQTPSTSAMRDKLRQPFSSTSIWNMPIGAGARYAPTGFDVPGGGTTTIDTDYFFTTSASDRQWRVKDDRPHYAGPRCYEPNDAEIGVTTYFPEAAIVPDIDGGYQPNNAVAILQPDGRTLVSFNAIARCAAGGPVYGAPTFNAIEDIYGPGITGGHGGSGLSSIGGSVRRGELLGAEPVTHALKVNVYCPKYCSATAGPDGGPGYRWPAIASDHFCGEQACGYGGAVPDVMMGSLLALPPELNEASANVVLPGCEATGGLTTEPGKKLFRALQDYGAYIADDNPSWDVYSLDVEAGVGQEVEANYGVDLNGAAAHSVGANREFWCDWNRIFLNLNVVTNNSAASIGGGGTPRAPLAPPIGN